MVIKWITWRTVLMEDFYVSHIYREFNIVVDGLSKLGVHALVGLLDITFKMKSGLKVKF